MRLVYCRVTVLLSDPNTRHGTLGSCQHLPPAMLDPVRGSCPGVQHSTRADTRTGAVGSSPAMLPCTRVLLSLRPLSLRSPRLYVMC